MATWRVSIFSCTVLWIVVLAEQKGADANLQAYGCDEGWTDFGEHCYTVVAEAAIADKAKNECTSVGASLSSVWSPEEKEFILSLWQFPDYDVGFLWLGLRGTAGGSWVYDDKSTLTIKQGSYEWSILEGVSGFPANKTNKCIALRNGGGLAFLDCNMDANAYVCKKALPKVFITATMLNHTSPVALSPMGHVQLFERMFPPVLTSLPADSSRLAEASVITEVGCAFRCFSVTGCQVFQVSCETSENCSSFHCVLFSSLTT